MKYNWLLCIVGMLLLISCTPDESIVGGDLSMPSAVAQASVTQTQKPPPSATQPPPPTDTIVPTETSTVTPSPTSTFTPTATPTWVFNEAGEVIAPILLYHHIADADTYSRYYVSPLNFRSQMEALQDWGYTAITVTQLLEALIKGAELPQRPVVISFDDGALDVYENAFPVMQELGLVGVYYILPPRIGAEEFVNEEQLREMIAAGWEVGSHSMSHADITLVHDQLRAEILQSRLDLNTTLGITVTTFAYPFGTFDSYIAQKVQNYGYRGAVGLGKSWIHTRATILYLNRIEIQGKFTLVDIASRLPWSSPLNSTEDSASDD